MQEDYITHQVNYQDIKTLPDIERAAARIFIDYLEQLDLPVELLDRSVPIAKLQQAQQENLLWVACNREEILIGFAYVEKLGEHWHLEELDVHPQYQKKGIGRALVKAICDRAEKRKIPAITLTTFRDIPWNAPFYEKMGFVAIAFSECSTELQELVIAEDRRGLRQDKRLIMQYLTSSHVSA
ncbi:MAG: GNAT family N-acetyltransferase [Cyanobacteria bacterium SBLK]|nr:GNAT family N-acetyltransferase [Cyanobacteria bacterium SBLK]